MKSYRPSTGQLPDRNQVPARYQWDLTSICLDWADWDQSFADIEKGIERLKALEGTLASSAAALLVALQEFDRVEKLMYKAWYFASLHYDQDQRDNSINAKRQKVQILFSQHQQATSWFNPELLKMPIKQVHEWMGTTSDLEVYRFAIDSLYHEQEHVLDAQGERLLSFAGRFTEAPHDAYSALTTADISFPSLTLSTGESVLLSYGQYRALLETNKNQKDRISAYRAFHKIYAEDLNTYAALYNGVLQRDWFHARSRGYKTTLEAELHGNNIPTSVVENLIQEARSGASALQRYHRLRRRVLGLDTYRLCDVSVPIVEYDNRYPYDEVVDWVVSSVSLLGSEYQQHVRSAFEQGWIDVFENTGKRSGAYSAPVYGSHPYMLLNYNETLDAVFTLAHEMGHSMHTLLAQEAQPFRYADYEIFVAEVPSTLSEALFLDFMLSRASSKEGRIMLLQHAIDSIASTFFTQVLFADFELQAHRLVEEDKPVTASVLNDIYTGLLSDYYDDVFDEEELSQVTWARIPHFFSTPYYVYQYATCFASTARLMQDLRAVDLKQQSDGVERYLGLLRAGGSDYPIQLLQKAGVDLTKSNAVRAVMSELDRLVTRLEHELQL